ncbi:MAG: signal peptide peptidase SppA, partial [Pseudomonadota bacterium]
GGMIKLLRQVEDDPGIRGVILRIDSPGGDGVASDDILHEVERLAKKKPLVISMSDMAASGGYFIAMSGDPIVAYPNTMTGSIGVLMVKPNLRGLYDKLGLHVETLSRGRYANIESESEPMDDAARAKFQASLEEFYQEFVTRVAEGRRRPYSDVEPLAQGRVWLGTQAKANGLVDALGGLDRAIDMVRRKARIAPGERITLVPYPRRRSLWEVIFSRAGEETSMDARLRTMLRALHISALPGLAFSGSWMEAMIEGGMLRMVPYAISVK